MSKGTNMIINQIIHKNNILTDGKLPDSAVLTQKLVNVLYFNYETQGAEFTIHLKDLCKQLDISNQTRNHLRIKDSLKILKQPIELRNFNDKKGRKLKWYLGSFLDKAKVFEDSMDYVTIRLDEDLIEGMKQHQQYTKIDIETSNKFKTKYGIVIWEMYLEERSAILKQKMACLSRTGLFRRENTIFLRGKWYFVGENVFFSTEEWYFAGAKSKSGEQSGTLCCRCPILA